MKITKTAALALALIACNAADRNTHEHDRPRARVSTPSADHPPAAELDGEAQSPDPSVAHDRQAGSTTGHEQSVPPHAASVDDGTEKPPEGQPSSSLRPSDATIKKATPARALSLSGQESIYQALVDADTASVAIFGTDEGIIAIDEHGRRVQISDERFHGTNAIVLDYSLGILWLDRISTRLGDPGLFIIDLFGPKPTLTKLTHLTRGYEIIGLDGSPVLLTQGQKPYVITMDSTKTVQVHVRADSRVICGDECTPSTESMLVLSTAIDRRTNPTSPHLQVELLSPPTGDEQVTFKNGTMLDVPGFPLALRYFRRPNNHGLGWQLYHKETKEYVSSRKLTRSKDPSSFREVTHLMVCDGGRLLVVNYSLFNSDLQRLDTGDNRTYGVCLSGGILFQNRTGFIYTDHVQAENSDRE